MSKWVSSQWGLSWRTRNQSEVTPIQPVFKVTGNLKKKEGVIDRWDVVNGTSLGTEGAGTQKEKKGTRAGQAPEGLWLSQRFLSASSRWRLQTCTCREPATGMRCTGTAQTYCKWLSTAPSVLNGKLTYVPLCWCAPVLITCFQDGGHPLQRSVSFVFSMKPLKHNWNTLNTNKKPNISPVLR